MAGEFEGKVAVVTGGARGLGRGMAELFAAEGGQVVIADVLDDAGEELARELGSCARFIHADVSDRASVQALVDGTLSAFGRLDAFVNNAGISDTSYGRLLDDDFSSFDRVMQINVLGTMLGTQIAARHMAQAGGGSIVNISSIGGTRPGWGLFAYRASKMALVNFTKSAALELAENNVRVNAVCPGNVPTPMGSYAASDDPDKARRIGEAVREARLRFQPLKRDASPRDVAEAVLWFASTRSLQVTGQVLAVDGGATAGDPYSQIGAIMEARASVE
jgi:NAD(P)-dependent dehydrogenase (short-subunit alcohol dehydrogenase family)